jgi:hypothetical protein
MQCLVSTIRSPEFLRLAQNYSGGAIIQSVAQMSRPIARSLAKPAWIHTATEGAALINNLVVWTRIGLVLRQ